MTRPKLKGWSFTALSAVACLAAEVSAEHRMEETDGRASQVKGRRAPGGFYFVFSTV